MANALSAWHLEQAAKVAAAHPLTPTTPIRARGVHLLADNDEPEPHLLGDWTYCRPNESGAEGVAFTIYPESTSEPLAEVLDRRGAERIAQRMAAGSGVIARLDALMERMREDGHRPDYADLLRVRGVTE